MPDNEVPLLIRETTAKNFLRELTDMRVSDDATELFIAYLTTMAEATAVRAGDIATEDERTTVLDRDIDTAFSELVQAGQVLDIQAAINAISNQDLSQLIQLLRADLNQPSPSPPPP